MSVIMNRERILFSVNILILAAVLAGNVAMVLPVIGQNIAEPNKIAYYDHDEGYIMDLVWYYYSGEKRDSFQYDRDYGLMYRYLADVARMVPSRTILFTPGTFVLILRWLNLISWVLAVIALWYVVRSHFGTLWQPLAAALLLATNQVFPVLSANLKPEPFALLFMIMGVHYALRLIERGSKIDFFLAVGFATIAFLVKYVGIFLLPAISVALYFGSVRKGAEGPVFRKVEIAWILPGLVGMLSIALASSIIFLYRRRITGLTWYQECGLRQALLHNRPILYAVFCGIALILVSAALWHIRHKGRNKGVTDFVGEMLSCFFITSGAFALFSAVIGYRWIIRPSLFIDLCAQTGREAVSPLTGPASAGIFLANVIHKIESFDPSIFILLMACCAIETLTQMSNPGRDSAGLYKRIMLLVFVLSFFPYMFSMAYAAQHSMLPFFAVGVILSLQAIGLVAQLLPDNSLARAVIAVLCAVFIALTVAKNETANIKTFSHQYDKSQDVALDAASWLAGRYPPETPIVADHPTRAHVAPGFNNVKFIKFQLDPVVQIRDLVESFKPRVIYLNTGAPQGKRLPSLQTILPDKNISLVAYFDSKSKSYRRYPEGRYEIYEITY